VVLSLFRQFLGAITFYSVVPVPLTWQPEFNGIARWSPLIGLLLGSILAGFASLLKLVGLPMLVSSALVVCLWVGLTGGLHLDGAMDSADGLAVANDQQHRLEVMADSRSGAFGVMAAILILLLKTTAIASLTSPWAIVTATVWGRWGQLLAIARYPYLKPTGKGAFHKQHLQLPKDLIFGSVWVVAWSVWQFWYSGAWQVPALPWQDFVGTWATPVVGMLLAGGIGYWFCRQLGGHTGDTYGAVVEWTEAFLLCYLSSLSL
jgi:adenosylcobinamide-GDP ribazoletransferase